MSNKCIGGFPGKCEKPLGLPNPHWCNECDKKRITSISKSLADIDASFKERLDVE